MRVVSEGRIRVLAADDSAVMREVMRTIFATHEAEGDKALPAMELCGVVRDGMEALEQVRALRPDVLLLDMEMPRLNGLGVLERLRVEAPRLPVILCSTHTERGARVTLDGLAHGAKDYVTKPEHQRNYGAALDSLRRQLLPKIAALAMRGAEIHPVASRRMPMRATGGSAGKIEGVVIGVSTGGPAALEQMLPMLPAGFGAAVLIVQHMPRLFTGALSERLNRLCRMPVAEARDGVAIEAGRIWLAPGDVHMEIGMGLAGQGTGKRHALKLRDGELENGCRPSVDVLFRSAAKMFGGGTLAVVMTGMGSDGTLGARTVREAGGTVLAQDEASSAVWGMPARVVEEGLADAVLPLKDLAGALLQRVEQSARTMAPALDRQLQDRRLQEVQYGLL